VGLLAGAVGVLGHGGVAGHQLPAARHARCCRDLFQGKGSWATHASRSPFVKAMEAGSIGVLNVAATCAGAGIIVGVVTLTGLGLKFSRSS
jgi:TRAP-type uncharacterized transport system fused permease subunit